MKAEMNKSKLLYVLLLVVTSAFSQDFDFKEGNFFYKINGSTTVTLVDVEDGVAIAQQGVLTIPKEVTDNNITYTVNTIGESVFDIGSGAADNLRFTELNLPGSIRTIEQFAFRHNRIKNLVLPNSVRTIGASAFRDNEMETIQYSRSDSGNITTANNGNLNTIGSHAFRNNNLTSITITQNVQVINDFAFFDNTITDVTLAGSTPPESSSSSFNNRSDIRLNVPENAVNAYKEDAQWSNFFSINGTYIAENNRTESRGQVVYKFIETGTNKVNIDFAGPNFQTTDLIINETITLKGLVCTIIDIESDAFLDKNMNSVTINGSSLQSIGANAFRNTGINELTFGSNVTGLKTISNDAFNGSNLSSVTIPASVETINDGAFRNDVIEQVTLLGSTPPVSSSGVFDNRSDISLNVPENAVNAYKEDAQWSNFFSINGNYIGVERNETIENISYQFQAQKNEAFVIGSQNIAGALTIRATVSFNNVLFEVTKINSRALDTENFPSVTIENGISIIEDSAFRNSNIGLLSLPESLTAIGESAFRDNIINNITLPSGLETIADEAFSGNPILTVTSKNSTPPSLEVNSFGEDRSETDLFVPLGTEQAYVGKGWIGFKNNIEEILFIGQTFTVDGLEYEITSEAPNRVSLIGGTPPDLDLIIPETVPLSSVDFTVEGIGEAALRDEKLTSVSIPDSVTTIEDNAFRDNDLITVNLGSGVVFIGGNAFNVNTTIQEVIITAQTPPTLEANSAFNNPSIPNAILTVPVGSLQAYQEDQRWSRFNTIITSGTIILDLKVFLQGATTSPNTGEETLMRDDLRVANLLPTTSPYADVLTTDTTVFETEGDNAIVDWVFVELRDAEDSSEIIASTSALVQRDGDIVAIDGTSPISFTQDIGNYFLSIKHRNHLAIITANAMSLSTSATTLDFTSDASLIAGGSTAMAEVSTGVFALFSGNFDGDIEISLSDRNSVRAELGEIDTYSNADADLNGAIELSDINTLLNINLGNREQF